MGSTKHARRGRLGSGAGRRDTRFCELTRQSEEHLVLSSSAPGSRGLRMEPRWGPPRRRTVRLLLVVAVLSTAVTACSASNPSASPPTPTTSLEQTSSASWSIPTAKDVVGRWRVVAVRGEAPPSDSRRDLTMTHRKSDYSASWSDGLNTLSVRWTLTPAGVYRAFDRTSTAVGCVDASCRHPSGFGVSHAHGLRIAGDGQLISLDATGSELSRYAPRA
jgi:hypothetical protein